jgi:hypothetical protein
MGLDVSHDAWHGAYSSFGRFRKALAKEIDIELDAMIGFRGNKKWPSEKKEPLVSLLNHSDCDGEIKLKDLEPLSKRLKEVAATLPDNKPGAWESLKEEILQFAEGCDKAILAGEDIEFG